MSFSYEPKSRRNIRCKRNTDQRTSPAYYACSSLFLLHNLPAQTGEGCERLATLSPVRKQLGISPNISEIGTKLLVPASSSLSETQHRNHNHGLEPLPNGLELEEADTISDNPTLDTLRAEVASSVHDFIAKMTAALSALSARRGTSLARPSCFSRQGGGLI